MPRPCGRHVPQIVVQHGRRLPSQYRAGHLLLQPKGWYPRLPLQQCAMIHRGESDAPPQPQQHLPLPASLHLAIPHLRILPPKLNPRPRPHDLYACSGCQ